jgi:hypothetical protein
MQPYLERLLDPQLLFGLAVRFFGVFIVLGILMAFLFLTGWIFSRMGERKKKEVSGGPSTRGSDEGEPVRVPVPNTSSPDAGEPVPEEVAAVVALSLHEAAGLRAASGFPVSGETAAAVALALSDPRNEHPFSGPHHRTTDLPPFGRDYRESPWKLLGRQEAVSRNNPWTGRPRTGREITHREHKA